MMLRRAFWLLLLLGFAAVLQAAAPAGSNESFPLPPVKTWQKTLEDMERQLGSDEIADSHLLGLRDDLQTLVSAIREARDAAGARLKLLRHDLDALGPLPADGAPAESATVVASRKKLGDAISEAEGIAKEADLLMSRADRAAETIKVMRRNRFAEQALTRSLSPLDPAFWSKSLPEWAALWDTVHTGLTSALLQQAESSTTFVPGSRLLAGFATALLLAFPVKRWIMRRLGRLLPTRRPSDGQRLLIALLSGLLNAWWPSLAALAIYLSLTVDNLLSRDMQVLANQALLALITASLLASFSASALRPQTPNLRLLALPDASARVIGRVIHSLAAIFAFDYVVGLFLAQQDVSVEVIASQNLLFGGLVTLALAALLLPRVWARDGQSQPGARASWGLLHTLLVLVIVAIPLSALLGYSVLSRLLASRLVITIGLLVLTWVLQRLGQELANHLVDGDSRSGRYLRRHLGLTTDGAEMLGFWVGLSLGGLLLLAGLLGLVVLWSPDKRDAWLWLEQVFRSFKLGGITISLADILLGLLLFATLLMLTRLLQGSLDRRLFPHTRLDSGVQHSIRSALGYAGFTLAAMAGISTMGIDLSNLAIIAGALSVGIGFGLQNIVNNFVSGLILLIERPIKAGDWVVVGDHQGYVRKISVRATEITTFDRASVFIPNSSLISGAVMNRTYADKVGRVLLPLGIDYQADPELARDTLLTLARANPAVKEVPAPAVMMTGFGESAINLELICFVHDVDKVKSVTSDLCFAIHAAFRERGIAIPFPQRELRLTLDDAQLQRIVGAAQD